jgi:uncharacterized protein (TIGR02594 family)
MAAHDLGSPPWMGAAWAEYGQREVAGPASNPRIRALYRDAGHPEITGDDVAWCAAFVGAVLERSGQTATRSLLARSYLRWGREIARPLSGAIAVFPRGNDPGAGHVGFVVGATTDTLFVLGGNQSDAVNITAFPRSAVLSLRWPTDASPVAEKPAPVDDPFETALSHVLEMEGGWSDDPFDPGGPTNRGLTLATYASFTGRTLGTTTAEALTFELKTISPTLVAQIYRERYWAPCRAYEMPAPVALMHFDAAVNHGVAGAARLLQQAAEVDIDGEIGPITMGAVRAADPAHLVDRYAEARRARYRALPHFWRFGRGWLARVDTTLAASRARMRAAAPDPVARPVASPTTPATQSPIPVNEVPMTTIPTPSQNSPEPKWWGRSLTIWGTIVTTLATVLPVIGPLIGLDITAEMVRDFGEQATRVIQAIGGLVGVLMTIWGRSRADRPLSRQTMQVRL